MTDSILQTAAQRLNYLDDVQNLLANNLANVDTPNYQPLHAVSFADYLSNQDGGVAMKQDNPADLQGLNNQAPAASSNIPTQEYAPDGNAVALDKQMLEISKNQTNQQFTANIYQAYMGMFKTALGTGS